jgi:hypothetical protein
MSGKFKEPLAVNCSDETETAWPLATLSWRRLFRKCPCR